MSVRFGIYSCVVKSPRGVCITHICDYVLVKS